MARKLNSCLTKFLFNWSDWSSVEINYSFTKEVGLQAFHFWKHDFELWVGGDGLTTWGWFLFNARNAAHVSPRSKNGPKTNTIRFVSTSWSFWWSRTSKPDDNLPSYAHSKLEQKWHPGLFWAVSWLIWPYFLRSLDANAVLTKKNVQENLKDLQKTFKRSAFASQQIKQQIMLVLCVRNFIYLS